MILFNSKTNFKLKSKRLIKRWITEIIFSYQKEVGDISFIFCNDNQLLEVNQKYLNHDYFTDVITFDYSDNFIISGDIFISIDRIIENSKTFNSTFKNELLRVIIHGILHIIGFKDKTEIQKKNMRNAENKALDFQIVNEIIL